MKKRYKAAPGARFSDADAERYGREIDRLEAYHGFVQPRHVVNSARTLDSPLRDYFEWHNREAATNWRTHQARELINSLRVVVRVKGELHETRAFYSVRVVTAPDTQRTEPAYVTVQRASANPSYRQQIVRKAIKEVVGWSKRYAEMKELTGVFRALRKAIKETVPDVTP